MAEQPNPTGFRRTTETNNHSHIAHLRPNGQGHTSLDGDSQHAIVFEEIINPETNERTSRWRVEPDPVDGHVHDVIPEGFIETSPPSLDVDADGDAMDEKEKVLDVLSLFREAIGLENESRERAKISEEFYGNKQWGNVGSVHGANEHIHNEGNVSRPQLTINMIQPNIDLLSGIQRQNRTDIRYLPVEDGDSIVADILNIVVKNILEQSNFEHEETEVFLDELITGRGLFHVFVDQEKNILGDIKIEKFPWRDVYFGPHENKDLSDLEYQIKAKLFSEAKIKTMVTPEQFAKIKDTIRQAESLTEENFNIRFGRRPISRGRFFDGLTRRGLKILIADKTAGRTVVDLQRKEILILEVWRKFYKKVSWFFNNEDGIKMNAEDWSKADVNRVKTIPGIEVKEHETFRMRKTVTAGFADIISDEFVSHPERGFSIIPAYASKRGHLFWGKVEAAKDMQREINKRHSQTVDIISKMSSWVWIVDQLMFMNKLDKEKFINMASTPGAVLEVADINRLPVKMEGSRIPAEVLNLENLSINLIQRILNITPGLQGFLQRSETGISLAAQQRQGLTGNEFLFDNLGLAKKSIGRVLVEFIQAIMTPERILRLVENQAQREAVQIGQMQIEGQIPDEQREAIIILLETTDLTKHDVVVSESMISPTKRLADFQILLEMRAKGVPVPMTTLISRSDIPGKKEILEQIQAAQQQEAQIAQTKASSEVQKSQVAAQGKVMAAQAKGGGRIPQNGGGLQQ